MIVTHTANYESLLFYNNFQRFFELINKVSNQYYISRVIAMKAQYVYAFSLVIGKQNVYKKMCTEVSG